ncbi:MAG: YebC/PmpR family DNA-binding transcriptional regulator [Deltaproteobacteria bacterium]|nr:YebC/PmpR family DNA-binding transcriptional regulator [Deltaproteobacteria bacterium]MBW2395121.1 YebC/PmpR family DNA-binding transcriptional regulator [Deltaproteobacteria bacterium]
MSGHSKWSTIKRKKGAVDAKRGKIFTKLIREIATAARIGGGEVDANPRLRLAVDKARAANMPKDNIQKGIQKGTGGGEAEAYEEATYEGYGPGGTAVLLSVLTDNRNRTVSEVRHVFSKAGGNLGENGCVAYLFEKRGLLAFDASGVNSDALMEAALEGGAEDVVEGEDVISVVTSPVDFEAVKQALGSAGFEPQHAEITMEPSTSVELAGKDAEAMLKLADALEDLDDVQAVYANYDIADEVLAGLAS